MACNHKKLHNLLKLSQTQMSLFPDQPVDLETSPAQKEWAPPSAEIKKVYKPIANRLFPHGVVEDHPDEQFANIVDDETAICSICEEYMPFIQDEADRGPDRYRDGRSDYVYVRESDLRGNVNYKIIINPIQAEVWEPQDQESYKKLIFQKITNVADSFKKIGESVYTDIFEKQFEIIVDAPSYGNELFFEGRASPININGSKVIVQGNSDISNLGDGKIKIWLVNIDGQEKDIAGIIGNAGRNYRNYSVANVINEQLHKEFKKRLSELLDKNNFSEILKVYNEILPFISDKMEYKNNSFIKSLYEIKNNPNGGIQGLFSGDLSSRFFTVSDGLNSVARYFSENENKPISTRLDINRNTGYTVVHRLLMPICLSCAEDIFKECSQCYNSKFKDEMSTVDGEPVCTKCMEDYSYCEGCNEAIPNEDANFVEEEGSVYCDRCYGKRLRPSVDVSNFDEPRNLASSDLFFLSGNMQTLDRLVSALESFKNKTKGGPASKLRQDFINIFKANGIKEDEAKTIINTVDKAGRLALMGDPVGEQDFKWYINSYISAIKNYISHQDDFYSKYPLAIDGDLKTQNIYSGKKIELLKNYQPIPVSYEYDGAHRVDQNFVIKMMPTNVFLEQVEELFPGVGKNAWEYFSQSGTQHHPGCIAYARISYDGNNFVIDNLQRDADLNNARPESYKARFPNNPEKAEMAEKALRWLDKRTSKWYVQFTDYLINFARNNDKKLYLTNFKTQKAKWGRIPEKNMEVYDNLPEELASAAFYRKLQEIKREDPSETAESLMEKVKNGDVRIYPSYDADPDSDLEIEDLSGPVDGIWRLAKINKILQIFKKSK